MAKYEEKLQGDFEEFLEVLNDGIMTGSATAHLEDSSDYVSGDVRCAVRVYERYSMIGENRVSLNITLIGNKIDLFISAITAGGSRAVLFKINTFGEKSFLKQVKELVEDYKNQSDS